jgi:VWFA-related protein
MLRNAAWCCALLVFSLCLERQALAQGSLKAPAPDEALKFSTELVLLDVQVLTRQTGFAVSGLRKEDFTVFEDGVKQEIAHFSYDRLPLSVVLLIDVSGSVLPLVERLQQSARQALERLKPEDEVAVLAFGKEVWLLRDFTRDRPALAAALQELSTGAYLERGKKLNTLSGGPTAIGEGIYYAAAHLIAAPPRRRRAILVITDNLPNDDNPPHSRAEVSAQLLDSGAVLHALIVDDAASKLAKASRYSPLGIFTEKVIFKSAGKVNGFVEQTGGKLLNANKGDAGEKLAAAIEQMRLRYSIGYAPLNTTFDGGFRKIKLKLSRQAEEPYGPLVIKTRQGYVAKPRAERPAGMPIH